MSEGVWSLSQGLKCKSRVLRDEWWGRGGHLNAEGLGREVGWAVGSPWLSPAETRPEL